MKRYVPLDTGISGLRCSSPMLRQVADCQTWLSRMAAIGTAFVLPDVTIYEFRRELIRVGATVKLARLDNLILALGSVRVIPQAWLRAAEFWAFVRAAGKPTAEIAATIGPASDTVTLATTNVGHLARFLGTDARLWEAIS